MMKRWADEEEQERSHFARCNNDNNGKRNNDHGSSNSQRDQMCKRKPDDVVRAIDRNQCGKKTSKP